MVPNRLVWKQPRLRALSATGALRAWTGGSTPAPLSLTSPEERATVRAFFREQVADYVAYWGSIGRDHLRLFWGRARHDAHATHRALPAGWSDVEWQRILQMAATIRALIPDAKSGTPHLLQLNRLSRAMRAWAKLAMHFHVTRAQYEENRAAMAIKSGPQA